MRPPQVIAFSEMSNACAIKSLPPEMNSTMQNVSAIAPSDGANRHVTRPLQQVVYRPGPWSAGLDERIRSGQA